MAGVLRYNDSNRLWGTRLLGRWLELARQGKGWLASAREDCRSHFLRLSQKAEQLAASQRRTVAEGGL